MALHYTGYIYLLGAFWSLVGGLYYYFRRDSKPKTALLVWKIGLGTMILAWLVYAYAFIIQDYTLEPVYMYSGRHELIYRFASTWASGGGSLASIASLYSLEILLMTRKTKNAKTILSSGLVGSLIVVIATLQGAYDLNPTVAEAGAGLNPLLQSPWIYPHPLATFLAYGTILAAATLSLAGLIRESKTLSLIAWPFLSLAILLGGVWSYETLGWGGYWAWDPVEVSELLPWLFLTASLHAWLLSRDLARSLTIITGATVFFALLVTRAGLSPLHGFANSATMTVELLGIATILFIAAGLRNPRVYEHIMDLEFRDPYTTGVKLSVLSLLYMGIVTFALLASSVIRILAGIIESAPTGDEAIKVYHPLLAPGLALLIVSMPLSMFGKRLSWKTARAIVGSGIVAGAILAFLGYIGEIVLFPHSSLATNVYALFMLPPTSIATATAFYSALRRFPRIGLPARTRLIIHGFTGLLVLGIIASGAYSFSQSYYLEQRVPLGESIIVGDVEIKLVSYEFRLQEGEIDAYTPYAGRSPIYYAGSVPIALMVLGFGETYIDALEGIKLLESKGLYELLSGVNITAEIEIPDANITYSDNITQTTNNLTLTIENGKLFLILSPGTEPNVTLEVIVVSNISVKGLQASNSTPQLLEGNTSTIIDLGSTKMNVTWLSATLSPHGGGNGTFINDTYIVENSMIRLHGELDGYKIPSNITDNKLYGLALFRANDFSWTLFRLVNGTQLEDYILTTGLAELESSFPPNCNWTISCLGYPPVPKSLPEGAVLELTFEIKEGDKVTTKTLEQRFELNGELQGIRGLVAKPLIVRVGTGDVYLEVYPPTQDTYHELMIYYLHEVAQETSPGETFSLASVLAMANRYQSSNPNAIVDLAMSQPGLALYEALKLYHSAVTFDPDNSSIATQGILVRAKVIPGIWLVWTGGFGMAASGFASVLLGVRREGE
ncbi:MAG: cytochrome c biogenesis protein CcsA [Desulfurococcales archaeon]|nr:cytochrome c biogenesis protein CcsA [Desulfurococcales archaeon]